MFYWHLNTFLDIFFRATFQWRFYENVEENSKKNNHLRLHSFYLKKPGGLWDNKRKISGGRKKKTRVKQQRNSWKVSKEWDQFTVHLSHLSAQTTFLILAHPIWEVRVTFPTYLLCSVSAYNTLLAGECVCRLCMYPVCACLCLSTLSVCLCFCVELWGQRGSN